MDNTLQIWVLSGVLGIVLIILGFLSKTWFTSVVSQLKEITKLLTEIKVSLISHEKDIEHLKEEHIRIHERLNNHSDRINQLEKRS